MIDSLIAMLTKRVLLMVWMLTSLLWGTGAVLIDAPRIESPQQGDALQGVVSITGSTDVKDFQLAEVAFRYEQDPADTWFLIQQSEQAVHSAPLAEWDTTTIADGQYRLRLTVILADGNRLETELSGLRVRNYTPVETPTPGGAQISDSVPIQPTATPAPTRRPATPTALPPNPAQVTPTMLRFSLVQGALFTVVIFMVFGIYLAVRRLRRRH